MNPFESILTNNKPALLQYLEGGNVNIVDEKGRNLLDYAIFTNHNEFFKLLLKSYIRLDAKDCYGNTCYHYAVLYNQLGFLKALLRTNPVWQMENHKRQSPLYLACLYGRKEMVLLFLEQTTFSLGIKDSDGKTAFMALVCSKNLDLIETLGQYQDWIDEEDFFGRTPLFYAVRHNDFPMVRFLLEQKAFVNAKDSHKETPLFWAVRNQNRQLVQLLLENGAYSLCKNNQDETIFDCCPTDFKEDLEELFYRSNQHQYRRLFPFHAAILLEATDLSLYLTPQYMYSEDWYGQTPLFLAEKLQKKELTAAIEANQHRFKLNFLDKKVKS